MLFSFVAFIILFEILKHFTQNKIGKKPETNSSNMNWSLNDKYSKK